MMGLWGSSMVGKVCFTVSPAPCTNPACYLPPQTHHPLIIKPYLIILQSAKAQRISW